MRALHCRAAPLSPIPTTPAADPRRIRNARGMMPYHIAMHKSFVHLAELLHPDIPYTYLFSNDDMVGGVCACVCKWVDGWRLV